MSSRPPNERVPNVGPADGASPYKRPRAQSPGAIQGVVTQAPQQRPPGAYAYPQEATARYPNMSVPTSYAAYTYAVSPSHPYALDRQPNKMAQTEGFRREIEIPTRRRPTLLGDYSSHATALDREKHAQEQQYLFAGYPAAPPDREVVAAGSYLSRGGPVPQAAATPQQPQPHQQVPPKRPKLAVEARPELTQPLRIDTANLDIKREPVYNPQVEAISPTVPAEDNKPELSSAQSSKEELLQSINRVDREIGKVEMQISKLHKKQSEFLAEQAKPPEAKSVTTDKISTEPKNQSIAQIIYAENRKKAESAHTILSKLGNKVDLPLYNQPSDTAVYHENKRSYMTFKKRLLLHFKKKHHSRLIRERYLTERYDQLMQAWLKRLERSENNAKRRAKDVRTREFFEKVFPELKKQREDRERIQSRAETTTPAHHSRVGANNRVGGYARSEAELEQIMDGLHEQEEEEKKMRSYAVIPPMLLDARERQIRFSNNNGRIEDPMTEYKERQVFNVWTQAEKDMFKERFLQHPKNFGYIASFLERKSVQECVQYYYLSKKNENYKQLLRKQSVKKRKFPKHPRMRPGVSEEKEDKPELVNDTEAVPIINTTPKVSFSVLRERKPQDERDRGPGPAAASVPPAAAAAPTAATSSTSPTPVTTSAPVTTSTEQVPASTQPATLPTSTPTTTSVVPTVPGEAAPAPCPETTPSTTLPPNTTVTEAEDKVKTEVKTEVKVEPAEENSETAKEVVPGDQGAGTHQCAICKSDLEHYARSRPLTKANCENYGIKEADLKNDMRVCSSCRCHSVRKRYTHCPVPMCKTPKRKVKRLRPLPSKWGELPNELKDPIIKELQLTDETTRCCSACFNRIARRLGNNPQTNEPLVPLVPENNDEVVETPRWTEEEMEVAKQGLREHGRDWAAISASVATKSEAQCKNFYFNYKRKFGLEQLVEESKRNKGKDGGDGRTISTSESVTSTITAPSEEDLTSSDEDNGEDNDETSDTASAPSPPPVHRSDQRHDSSTVEAMEVDDKKDVDKSVVEEKPAGGLATTNPTLSASQGSLRSIPDYDSSATLSADEGPPSSSHTHDTDRERKSDPAPTAAVASTATSEQYVSSSRTYSSTPSSGPQQTKPLLQGTAPGHSNMPGPGPNMPQEGTGITNHRRTVEIREGGKAPTGLMDRRSSPACVRDLIDCAIERNIVQDQRNMAQDLRTQKEQQAAMGDYHGHPLAQHMVPTSREGGAMPGTGHLPPQATARMPFAKEAVRKELSHRDTPELAPSSSAPTSSSRPIVVDGPGRQTDSPYPHPSYAPQPHVQPRTEDQEVQDLSRRPLTQPVRDRSPHTAYKGNPRDYDPHDPRYHELYRRHAQQPESVPTAHLRAPPPAHSHHPGMKRHGAAPSEGLHQLASAASEREPHRPHSEPREKSPSTYMPERSQMTPPALRQSVSPYPMDRQQQQHARQAQMGRNTHGGPPPLIKQTVGGKPPMKSEKMSPIGQPPPGGSITQGTPVQHPPSSQPQSARFEGSISMGTPRGYDSGMRAAPVAPVGSISMGTPRYEQGAARGTPPMHPEGGMAPRMPGMYDRATYEATIRMMQDSRGEMYRRLSPTGQPGTTYYPASMAGYAVPQQAAAQQYQSELSSSRAVLMGDFLTAQQMQHAQEAQRRADKERQLSPRSRDSMGREAIPGKPYAATVMEAGMPPPFGHVYVHAGQVPGSQQERIGGGRTASPMPSPQEMAQQQQQQQPRESPGHPAGWPQGHPGVSRGVAPSQASPGGQQQPDDHRHPTPPPRQNVIRSITHGTAGNMIMERMPSPRSAPQVNTHLNGSSPFATLVNVAVNAPSLAVPPKDRHQLSPSIRDHPKERAHAIAMEQERHERENERRDREAQIREGAHPRDVHHRDAALSEAQRREAQYHREAQEREALRQREAHQRGVHHREALAREQAREDHHRGIQRAREAQQAQLRDLDRRDQEIMLANRYSKEMEARQAVNAERERQERHEREKMERERMDMMMNDAHNREGRPSSREGYHGHPRPPGSSGTMRQLDRPPEPRAPYRNHMEGGPPGPSGYPYHMSQHGGSGPHHSQQPAPPSQRPEAVSMAQRPPSRDSKLLEAQERRTEFHSKESSAMGPNKSGSGGGGGSSGSSAGSAGPAETFTAANLIDAIIIHTINNGSNSNEEDKMAGHGGSSGGSREPASSSSGPASSEQTTKYMHNSLAAAQSRQPHHGQPPHSSSSQPPVSQSHHHLPHPSQPSHHHLPPHHQPPHHHHHPHQQQQQQQHPGGGKIDLTKDQRSPPYKPHKHGYEPPPPPHLDVSSHHTDSPQSSHPHHPQQRHHPPQHHHQQQQPHQQQMLQRELSSSSTSSHQGVSSSADVERSQGGSPASDKSVKSNHSAQSSASSRAITLGEHIDAIIIQDYNRKGGQGSSPNNGHPSADSSIHPATHEGTSKSEDMSSADLSAIKSFLDSGNNSHQPQQHHHHQQQQHHHQQQQQQQQQQQPKPPQQGDAGMSMAMAAQSPPMRPMSSPSSHGVGHSMAPDSSGSGMGSGLPPPPQSRGGDMPGRQRSMSVGNQHKQPLPYRPPPMLGTHEHLMREAARTGASAAAASGGGEPHSGHHHHQPPPPQPLHNGPHRHPSPQPPPPQHTQPHGPPSQQSAQVHRPTPPPSQQQQQHSAAEQGAATTAAGDNRPRSFSAGAHNKMAPVWNNWKVKRALQQQERDQQQHSQQVLAASGHPQPASVQSPMVLAPDEREIVKVARLEAAADPRVSQSGQPDRRSPLVGYNMNPISPASSSTDSGGPESSMKTSPPRSPRIHQGGSGGVSLGMLGHAALTPGHQPSTQSQKGLPAGGGQHQQISSLAASHQAITSLLSRPQNKQNKTSSFPADSSVMGQRGEPSPTGHRQHVNPLTYVQDKIAEVMQNSEASPRPSSSTASPVESAGGSWDKRHMLHPLDAGRYGGPRGPVESSTHRGEWAGDRYLGGRSPLRDDTVTASRQRSPRPSIHSQSSEESQGSAVSSAEDVYNATSSTGAMKPPSSTGSGGGPPPPGALAGRDYRDRLVSSPMMAADGSGYPHSPRPSYTNRIGSMAMAESSSSSRSPQFSPVGTSDMVVSGSGEDMMRPNQSGAASEPHSSDHRTHPPPAPAPPHARSSHAQSPREPAGDTRRMSVDNPANSSGMALVESPPPHRMVIDEVGGADSSAQALERISPSSDGSQTAASAISTSQHQQGSMTTPSSSSNNASRPEYMDVDSQSAKLARGSGGSGGSEAGCRAPGVAQSPHHTAIESSSTSVTSAISSSGPPHVDSSRSYSSPHYSPGELGSGRPGPGSGNQIPPQPHSVHTSSDGGGNVSTSSAAAANSYGGRYLYPGLANQHTHNGAPMVQRASPATSPAPMNREADTSPLLQPQYDALSDDE